ncbi:AI-2E family transporter [Candidatus Nanosalina sp. VS9-1]|uniref:AI-2E family transporter n=1 Tax=Candidatus Nanosalina sp. VS9-1 TaxID=3388566 RepID=UPI0039E1017F
MNERKGFLLFLIGIFGTVVGLMLMPFLTYILGATILAFILRRPHFILQEKIGARPSAAVLTVSAILLAVLPIIFGGMAVADDATDLVDNINTTDTINLTSIEDEIERLTGQEIDIESNLARAVEEFSSATLGSFSRVVNIVANVGIGLSLMLFLVYYFLKDGRRLVRWVKDVSPLPESLENSLLREVSVTTSAVMKGHILVAIAQGIIAGVGLAFFGVPNYVFWTFIMMILGLLPIVGSMLVWLPAAGYLALTDPVSGIMLALYGFIAVGLSDNFLRPLFVESSADLHPALIILGVIGGVVLLGAPGLFIGPVIFGVMKSILTVFMENYQDL